MYLACGWLPRAPPARADVTEEWRGQICGTFAIRGVRSAEITVPTAVL